MTSNSAKMSLFDYEHRPRYVRALIEQQLQEQQTGEGEIEHHVDL